MVSFLEDHDADPRQLTQTTKPREEPVVHCKQRSFQRLAHAQAEGVSPGCQRSEQVELPVATSREQPPRRLYHRDGEWLRATVTADGAEDSIQRDERVVFQGFDEHRPTPGQKCPSTFPQG